MKVTNPTFSNKASSKVTKRKRCLSTGKAAFNKRKQALSYGGSMHRMFNRKYTAYKCPSCNYWHLTTKET